MAKSDMLYLFHTGYAEIRDPDIHYGRKNADFGQGFYLTPDREFTYRWAGADAFAAAMQEVLGNN